MSRRIIPILCALAVAVVPATAIAQPIQDPSPAAKQTGVVGHHLIEVHPPDRGHLDVASDGVFCPTAIDKLGYDLSEIDGADNSLFVDGFRNTRSAGLIGD